MRGHRGDAVLTALTVALGAVSLGFCVWVWSRTQGLLATVAGLGTLSENDANFLGLLSLDLLLLMVLLLARLPWLERTWGRHVVVRLHRWLGIASLALMLGHVGLFALSRATRGGPVSGGEALLRLFVTDRHMLLASIGTALVVLVALTSWCRVRRVLRYELWHLVHLWAYVGTGLVLPHVLVAADLGVGVVAAFWWGLYVLTLAAVLWFRVLVPVLRSRRHALRVLATEPEAAGAVSITVGGRDLERLGARAGQFLTWRLGRWTQAHPYSLSAAPSAEALRITAATDGDDGLRLAALAPGTRVSVEGPYGPVGVGARHHDRLLLVAAGIGVTPYRAVLEELPLRPGEVTLLHRVHGEAVLADEIDRLAARRGIEVVRLVGPRREEWSWLPVGTEGSDEDVLQRLVPDVADCDVRVCGPEEWSEQVRWVLRACGVRRRDVREERFGW
ncbi:oxidoreductase [Marmoricola endophyticus]|uniref:Oxidoreductase n=1 Tax=Marmoricola endophyticus TaxID=2040280 RepID=A0A917BKN4_9ACTN|nr:ferric reductase-like transmembrane domain-containing protein [Marmoricola endophyticus]GGF49455.1 oxidoreductase [Marmoricola endophyticus]